MRMAIWVSIINLVVLLGLIGLFGYLTVLLIKALRKYLASTEEKKEQKLLQKTLGEALKEQRTRCQMTQEFVAERLHVSRQAVSKWENGLADPSTSNLIALARLYGVRVEELLGQADAKTE